MSQRMERNTRSEHIWNAGRFSWDLSRNGLIMGILNVTPDSFSDGGRYIQIDTAVAHGLQLVQEGADILDVGGESTRPGAAVVSASEELARVIPVIERLRSQSDVALSIDTSKASVALAALQAGVDIVNDISGFRDPAMIEVCSSYNCGLVAMHMKGVPLTMQKQAIYQNLVEEVREIFLSCLIALEEFGISEDRVLFDPGIGFGKNLEHNLALLRQLPELAIHHRPLLVGLSRKSFIAQIINDESMSRREHATIALTSYTRAKGALVHRVHAVKECSQALKMTESLL